jgi:hypothetical protein
MKDLIFESMIIEASARVSKLTRKGKSLNEAIALVAEDMELNSPEVKELETRAKKAPKPKVVEDEVDLDAAVADLEDEESTSETPDNTICFANDEELESALGVLMYKGIPWVSRDATSVTFMTPDHVREAHEALKRRWDFVNNDERTVAVIEFDNLDDYAKVVDFIASKRMMVVKGSNDELIEDADQAQAAADADYKKAKKAAKEAGLPDPEAPSKNMSYNAVHKDAILDAKSLDVLYDDSARCLRVVKRWK